jgi:hypothetical protein
VLKVNSSLTSLILQGKHTELVHPFSLNTENEIGKEGTVKLAEALKSNSSLTLLNHTGNKLCCFISFSLNTDNDIGTEGAINLSEALKFNSTLISLDLKRNRQIASFRSHSIQIMILVMKELSNYLKHSN